ncbi:hypothetical protein BCR43DRAFT_523146 [Syncephalastrum racemosum]|uniref:HTH APSES-type domain-containing protein n=1 Tax=Syncephalastrum racemosum TaxID=13706 RepID=A0A1X2HJ64_SYNRA|nr:hypothetical protein BCR43DRAFT_523146 [Syncephalastrum racemosum]
MAERNSKIYTAVYSGVAVFETIINSIAVMRRRSDSYMNATQILKVAGIEKGRRTKILEREVHSGEHEKVQGGYGKYQGTWIPLEIGRELAQRYGVMELLLPIVDFDPADTANLTTKEQALAAQRKLDNNRAGIYTKHTKSSPRPSTSPYAHRQPPASSTSQPAAASPTALHPHSQQPSSQPSSPAQQHGRAAATPGTPTSAAHLPSPLLPASSPRGAPEGSPETRTRKKVKLAPHTQQQQQQQQQLSASTPPPMHPTATTATTTTAAATTPSSSNSMPAMTGTTLANVPHPSDLPVSPIDEHRNLLMSIFLSDDTASLPDLLTPNADLVVDDHGNTPLHWSAAMARTAITHRLIARGANPRVTNQNGETPLVRCVLHTYCWETGAFPVFLDAFKDTLSVLDRNQRSVLHHAAKMAAANGRVPAAVYYMSHLLQSPATAAAAKAVLDLQDDRGDTALHIASQLGCTELVDALLKAGACVTLENSVGLCPDDYKREQTADPMAEDQPQLEREQSVTASLTSRPHGSSQRGREIVSTVQKIVDAMDEEYGVQLNQHEQELRDMGTHIQSAKAELEQVRKQLETRQTQSQQLIESQQRVRNLDTALEKEYTHLLTWTHAKPPYTPLEPEAIDADFDVATDDAHRVRKLKARVAAYRQNDADLQAEVDRLRAQSAEKELQCKRLIAACCQLPIEKIDELVEPLTLAIESDPPDLDLARVIGFMEKIRRQGAFATGTHPTATTSSSSSSSSSPSLAQPVPPPPTAAATAAVTDQQAMPSPSAAMTTVKHE